MSDRRIAWLSCSAGVAGDMVLGALIDAGAELAAVTSILGGLALGGWTLEAERVSRGGIAATRAIVTVEDDATSRTFADISLLLSQAVLPELVRARAQRVFGVLADAEAALHGVTVAEVHFHEVGGHDALIDIVGVAAALEVLEIDEIACSPVGLGYGTVRSAHGILPSPAPATVALLEGFALSGVDVAFETATPTGAALLAGLCSRSSAIPGMVLESQGFGAGTRDLDGVANVVGAMVGIQPGIAEEQVVLLETNLDDVTGEQLGHAISELLDRGALDAWVTPATMKKGRPGHVLSVLCVPDEARTTQEAIAVLTGTLGVRATLVARSAHRRATVTVDVLGHQVRVKVSAVSAKPEFDDLVRVATATALTVPEIDELARAALEG